MGMVEITERTTVKEPDGTDKVLLPGRITQAEADQYGITDVKTAVTAPEVATTDEAAKPKSRKKA